MANVYPHLFSLIIQNKNIESYYPKLLKLLLNEVNIFSLLIVKSRPLFHLIFLRLKNISGDYRQITIITNIYWVLYLVPDTILNILDLLIHLILTVVLWDMCWYCPHFINVVIEIKMVIETCLGSLSLEVEELTFEPRQYCSRAHTLNHYSLWYMKFITFLFLLRCIITFHLRLCSTFFTHQASYYSFGCFLPSVLFSSNRENAWTESKNIISCL